MTLARSSGRPRLRFVGAAGGLARRLAGIAVTLVLVSVVIFSAVYATGGPEAILAGARGSSPEALAALRARYGIDQPLVVQYWTWLTATLSGDLGVSLQYRTPVATVIGSRVGTTLALVAYAAVIALAAGVALGALAALSRGSLADRAVTAWLSVLTGVPAFVSAVALVAVFALGLGWFPATGGGTGVWDRLWHLTLPALALAGTFVALVGRVSRAALIDQLEAPHVAVAVARGLGPLRVFSAHVLRGALPTLATTTGLLVAGLLAASTVAEQAFGLSGLGSLLIGSIIYGDLPLVQAVCLIMATVVLLVNALADVAVTMLDPRRRARMGAAS